MKPETVLPDFWAWLDGTAVPKQREPEPDPEPTTYAHAVTGSGQRKRPSAKIRQAALKRQRNRCLYCGHKFGTVVQRTRRGRGRNRTATLRINWDHFVPYAYGLTNGAHNWVAACHVCNNIKSCRMFDTVREAQAFVRARWAEKGYELLAPLLDVELAQPAQIDIDDEPEPIIKPNMTPDDVKAAWDAYDRKPGEFREAIEAGFLAAFEAGWRTAWESPSAEGSST